MLLTPINDPATIARQAKLRYVSDNRLKGFTRKRVGTGFAYYDPKGELVKDTVMLERLKSIYIPPAWNKVWISPYENGHILATGRDEKGRKQYVYHQQWIDTCQENKFNKVIFFGHTLPLIRERVEQDMSRHSLSKERVLATLVWLLQTTFIRIGNEEYAKANESYGLTTLKNDHVELTPSKVTLEFKGKSGVMHNVDVTNPRIVRTIRRCVELPGYDLFRYEGEDGQAVSVDSEDVNNYLGEITGEELTAKDFRTWGGTMMAANTLSELGDFDTIKLCKKNVSTAVKDVSKHLRNTPTVCRKYYIHPQVVSSYEEGELVSYFRTFRKKPEAGLTKSETALIDLLEKRG